MIEGCKTAVTGAGGPGDQCNSAYECQIGSYCKLEGCPGVCTTYPGLGAGCSDGNPCDPSQGLYCEATPADGGAADAGTAGICQAFVAIGADCSRKNSQCVPGAFCIGNKCERLTDVFTLNSGQACFNNSLLCNPGLSCEFSGVPYLSAATCTAQKATNAACRLSLPSECPKGSYCTVSVFNTSPGQCVGTPTETQACAMGGEQSIGLSAPCAAGLACVNGICKSRKLIGDACETNAQCYSGYCAPGDGGTFCAMPGCAP
jgi:hypothetical protein